MYEIINILNRIALAIENLSQNNEKAINIIECRIAELKREYDRCKNFYEISIFESEHLAIEELERLLINLKG